MWSSTVYIVNYDENDGLFDHMVPPLPPAGTPNEFVNGLPIGGGVRVPCFVVSPWSVGGFVATEQFDHTSVLQFLETLTGVKETNISDWRREAFGDLTSALGFTNGRRSSSPPHLPPTIGEFWEAEEEVADAPCGDRSRRRADSAGAGDTPPAAALDPAAPRSPGAPRAPGDAGHQEPPEENRTTHSGGLRARGHRPRLPGQALRGRGQAGGAVAPTSRWPTSPASSAAPSPSSRARR